MAACLSVLPASQSPIYSRTAILIQNEQEPPMETPVDYFNRKLTDEELVAKLRKLPANRACREAADRIEELAGLKRPAPSSDEPV